MNESSEPGAAHAPPERSPAEELFARHLETLAADQEVDIEGLVGEHPAHEAELRRLHEHWQRMTGVADASAPSGSSSGRDGASDPARPPSSSPSHALSRLAAHAPGESRYELGKEIARGGMGAIIETWDADLRRTLAMKVMLRRGEKPKKGTTPGTGGSAEDERILGRFLDEAQVTAQLDHPGIVPVHELGLDAEGRVYFTMPLIKGQDLSRILEYAAKGVEGWTQNRVLGVIHKVCEAMAYAHSKKVIHRDLKPANVMAGRFGEVYVMDWGLARVLGKEDTRDLRIRGDGPELSEVITERGAAQREGSASQLVTMDGDIVGTPSYMSPEQARGDLEAMGPPSDVYSIGCILYHLLAGQMPYVPEGSRMNVYAVWGMLQNGPPAAVRELAPTAPEELVAICAKAMARDPHDRYADTVEMAEDLRAYLEGRVVQAHRTGPLIEFKKWVQRNKALAATEAAALVLALGALSYFAWYQADKNEELQLLNKDLLASQHEVSTSQESIDRLELELQEKLAKTELAETAANQEKRRALELSRELEDRRADLEFAQSATEDALEEARRQAYVANITAASLDLKVDNSPEVRRRLDACASDLRGWEWDHLRLFGSAAVPQFQPQRAGARVARFAAGSSHVVRLRTDGALEVLEGESGELIRLETTHKDPPRALAVSPDGALAATGSPDRSIRFAQLTGGPDARPILGACVGEVGALAFTIDGRRIVAGEGSIPVRGLNNLLTFAAPSAAPIYVFDVATGERVLTLEGHDDAVRALAVHPDGRRLLSASADRSIVLWDLQTGQRLSTYRGHAGSVESVAFTPGGERFVSGSADWLVQVWGTESGERSRALRGHSDAVRSLAVSRDGRRAASASDDGTVRLWDLSTGAELETLRGHETPVTSVDFSADGTRLLSASPDEGLRMWDAWAATPVTVLRQGDQRLGEVELAYRDARGGKAGPVWSLALGDLRHFLGQTLRSFPDAERVVLAGRGLKLRGAYDVDVWNARTGELLHVLRGHTERISAVDVSPDGTRIVSASADETLRVWDAATGELQAVFADHSAPITCVTFAPDGRRVASGATDGRVLVHDLRSARVVVSQGRHGAAVRALVWHPAGDRVTSGGDDETVRVWSAVNGFESSVLYGHRGPVTALAYLPGGERLFSGSRDGAIRVWHPEWGQTLLTLGSPGVAVDALFLSSDGERLVSVELTRRPVLTVWDSDPERAQSMWREREAALTAQALVDELCGEFQDPRQVIEAIRARPGLEADVRSMAEDLARRLEETGDGR